MLGGGSQGNGAFSSSSTLPPARRHHQQTSATTAASCWNANNPFISALSSVVVPSTASEEALPTAASNLYGLQASAQRKRPGCKCDNDDDDSSNCHPTSATNSFVDYSIQPLDLSLPKVKVRQHWSGGSIVQVNESTISIGDFCHCPASAGPSSRLNVSIVTVPQHQPCWPTPAIHQNPVDRPQQEHHQQQQPFRLQIEIPLATNNDRLFRNQQQQQQQQPPPPQRRKSSAQHCTNNNNIATRPPEVSVMAEEDDDLRRLSDSAHQLRLSGYYYGHLSWKESVQLLQNTKVGTFLVRDSSDARFLYALSLQTDKGPTSVRIHYSSRGFRLDASGAGLADHLPRFRTVLDLVDYYVAKWSLCRDKGQFWLDDSGQVHSEVVLIRPLMRDCPKLKHLCRLVWNQHRTAITKSNQSSANYYSNTTSPTPSSVDIPPTIKSYLKDYPNLH